MFQKKDFLMIGIVGAILGFFVIQQLYLHDRIAKTIQPENENNLALEVSELIKNNTALAQEVDDLTVQHNKLTQSAADAKTANQTLEENLVKYKTMLGIGAVSGEGVEISFDNKLSSTQLVDLINAIKNIGAEAIQINDQRVTPNTSISDGFFNPPSKIKVIGSKELLYESLVRSGGILEQIGFGAVVKSDNLEIKAK